MDGKFDNSVRGMVIFLEAFRMAHAQLESEQLLQDDEHPLKIGITAFTTEPIPILDLTDDITDVTVANSIDLLLKADSGGTDETAAIAETLNQMTLHRPEVIKLGVIFTDGAGNTEATNALMRQKERDEDVIIMVLPFDGGEEVEATYTTDRTGTNRSNVLIVKAPTVPASIQKLEEVFQQEVPPRIERLFEDNER